MTEDQTTTDTAAEIRQAHVRAALAAKDTEIEQHRIALADAMRAPHAETVAELVERVRNLDAAFVKEVTEVGRLRAEKSALLTDTGRDFTRLFRALGLVQETDMGEAIVEAGRIYDERDRLRTCAARLLAEVDRAREILGHYPLCPALDDDPEKCTCLVASAVDGGGEKTLAELRAALAAPARPAPTESGDNPALVAEIASLRSEIGILKAKLRDVEAVQDLDDEAEHSWSEDAEDCTVFGLRASDWIGQGCPRARPAPTEEPGETRVNVGDRVTTEGVGCVGTVQEVWPYSARVLWDDDTECCEPIDQLTVQPPAPSPQENSEGPR